MTRAEYHTPAPGAAEGMPRQCPPRPIRSIPRSVIPASPRRSRTACQSNRPVSWTNPLGDTTSFGYNAGGTVGTIHSPMNEVTSIAYDNLGGAFRPRTPSPTNLAVITNPRGYVATLGFTSSANLITAINGAGDLTTYTWDTAGTHLLSIGDGNGNLTSFTYATLSTINQRSLASIQ